MHKINLALAAGAALLLAGTASAERAARDPDQTICRSERSSTSRISSRTVCHTRAEWRIINETRRRDAERATDQSSRMQGPPLNAPPED